MARDNSLLEAALRGYEAQAAQIEASIADIQKRLGIPGIGPVKIPGLGPLVAAPRKKRRMSAEGRARIAEAQRKRWAAAKKAK
jgi:hypothetical protein